MPNLKALNARIKSVKSTQKITKVMKMIAASKISSSTKKANNANEYRLRLNHSLAQAISNFEGGLPWHISGSPDDSAPPVIIAVSSDKGLCGVYNSAIIKALAKLLGDWGQETQVIAVGKKVSAYLRNHRPDLKVIHSLPKPVLDTEGIAELTEKLLSIKPSKASVIYTRFVSSLKQEVSVQPLIPFTPEKDFEPQAHYHYEHNHSDLMDALSIFYMRAALYSGFASANASENMLRMIAMDNASKNAKEMIQKLTLLYNQTRQSIITKELIEIISGSEALK